MDEHLRALLRVPVSASRDGDRWDLVAWIDTAFNGGLAIPRKQVANLGQQGPNFQNPTTYPADARAALRNERETSSPISVNYGIKR